MHSNMEKHFAVSALNEIKSRNSVGLIQKIEVLLN